MKRSRFVVFILILFSIFSGCNNATQQTGLENSTYLEINRNGYQLDTVLLAIEIIPLKDSVYRLRISETWIEPDTNFFELLLPMSSVSKNQENLKLISVKEITYNERFYSVYKYILRSPGASDMDILYFFNPEVGLILQKDSFVTYLRLISNPVDSLNDEIFYLSERTLNDSVFFNH